MVGNTVVPCGRQYGCDLWGVTTDNVTNFRLRAENSSEARRVQSVGTVPRRVQGSERGYGVKQLGRGLGFRAEFRVEDFEKLS